MKKRIFSLTAALLAAACIFTGCDGKDPQSASPETEEVQTADAQDQGESDASKMDGEGQAREASPLDTDADYGPKLSELDIDEYITLGEYKGLTVSMDSGVPTDEEVQDYIDSALKEMATEEIVTGRPVQSGDVVDIDFEGKKDGVAFEGGTAQGYSLEIGSHSFIEGFEDGLIGAQVGESRDLNLKFPEDYHAADLAGADVVFHVTVNSISEKKEPELTDETAATLASNIGKTASNVDEYKKAVSEKLQEENEESAIQEVKGDLMMQIVDGAEIKKVPEGIVDEQLDVAVMQANSYASQMGMSTDEFLQQYMGSTLDEYKETYKEYATEGAKQMLAIYAIAKKEGLTFTPEEVKEKLSDYVANMGYSDYDSFINTLEGRVNEEYLYYDKVAQFVYDNAKIVKQ